jgi:Uma2 family endonuclease
MATAIQLPPRPDVEYPDSDGKPMSDNTLQFRWIVTIKEGVEALFRRDSNVFVAGDLLWYAVQGDNTIRTGPDVLVAFGRPKSERGSYKQWEEGGIAPQVVFDVPSPGNRAGETQRRFDFYNRYGVQEYYIYDPDSGLLEGWRRRGRGLKKIARIAGFVSPRLGIRFEPGKGPDNLAIFGPDGRRFLSFQELVEQSEAVARRAEEAERSRAAAEQRAETAEQRAERYAAKLRELGIEPE